MAYTAMYDEEQFIDSEDKRIGIALLRHILGNVYNPIISYGTLARMVGYPSGHGTLDSHLGNLSAFCEANGLPRISAAVCRKADGCPGKGFFTAFYGNVSEQKCMEYLDQEYKGIIAKRRELENLLYWMEHSGSFFKLDGHFH